METKVMEPGADLVAQAQGGDRYAFEKVVRHYQRSLRAFLAAHLPDPSSVDDLAQDAFLVAYSKLEAFDPTQSFQAWLKGIALNLVRNHRRKRRPALFDKHDRVSSLLDEGSGTLANRFYEKDVLAALNLCIKNLGNFGRRLISARYSEGQSLDALSSTEGKSAKALCVALVRVRQQLRECMDARMKP